MNQLLGPNSNVEAVVTLGGLAADAWADYRATPSGAAKTVAHVAVTHPTFPDSASASGNTTFAKAMKDMLANWNVGLEAVDAALTGTDTAPSTPSRYGTTLQPTDMVAIPSGDLPAGSPPWMSSLHAWAKRTGKNSTEKRSTITVTIPPDERPF